MRIYGVDRNEIVIRFVAVILLFGFAECTPDSCLHYGSACWGGHGKRSSNLNVLREPNENPRALKTTRWFLSKLIQGPMDYRYSRDNDFDVAVKHNSDPLFVADEVEGLGAQEQWHKNQNAFSDDQLYDDNFLTGVENNRIRLPKILDKRSTKQN